MAISSHAFSRPAASTGTGQTDPLTNALLKQAFNPQRIRHPMQVLDQLSKAALLARELRKGEDRRERMGKTYADALRAGTGRPAETSGGIDWKAQEANPALMAQILAGNRDTASFGMEMQFDAIQESRKQAHEMALQKAKRKYDADVATEKRRLDAETWEIRNQKKHADALELAGGKSTRLTPAQQANNQEIDEARARLEEMEQKLEPGVSLADDIHRRISVTDPTTGRLTPDYNSFLGRTAWQAMQRKVGEDRDQGRWSRLLVNPPEFSDPAGAKQFPEGYTPPEAPSLLDRGLDFLGLGGEEPPLGQAPATSSPRPRRGHPRGRSSAQPPVERMSIQEIDDLINARGDSLAPADLRAIEARLAELGG